MRHRPGRRTSTHRRKPDDRRRGPSPARGPERKPPVHGVARWISKFGLMSRAEAERCVLAGRVAVNGVRTLDPERPTNPERDTVSIDGRPLRAARKVYLAMNKPAGCITTAKDPLGRPTAYDLLPPGAGSLQAVGRLDADTSGLLLFTNDTDFAARVADAGGGVEKVYVARIGGRLRPEDARRFESGVELDGTVTRPARCRVLESDERAARVEVTLTEGRNRQVRRMWEALGYPVLELERVRVGPVTLTGLAPGRTRPLDEFERTVILLEEH
ncbi:MAG: rRNA pseudouridine synthase [Planctomycetes bacterium]|nr:rRNA pseudouridine synthase [Planctomycetota bacterium]